MKKKTALLLAGILSVSMLLTACGNSNEPSGDNNTPSGGGTE